MQDHSCKKTIAIIIIMTHMTQGIQWRLSGNSQSESSVLPAGGPIMCQYVGAPMRLNAEHMKYLFHTRILIVGRD